MTFPLHSFRDLRHSTLSMILLIAFAGIAGCGNDNSPTAWSARRVGWWFPPAASTRSPPRGTTSPTAKASLAQNATARTSPAGPRRFPASESLGLPPRPGGRVGRCIPAAQEHGTRRSGPPAAPASSPARSATERTSGSPEATETEPATLPQPGSAPGRAVAHLYWIDAHDHGPVERPRVRRLPPEQYLGDARLLQQHAVPRPHRSRRRKSLRAVPGAPHTTTDPASFATSCSACHAVTASRRIPRRLSARCVTSPPPRCPSRTAPRATPGRRRGPSIRTSPAVTPGTMH